MSDHGGSNIYPSAAHGSPGPLGTSGGYAGGASDSPTSSALLEALGVPATQRCAGLEYANMKKEEAREQYKDRRRRQLLNEGHIERVKRRKKNDSSMSEDQKYNRRLKMNQDSAAAARVAQEAYVSTLEKLVETAEAEKSMLALESSNLRQERNALARRLSSLQMEIASSLPAHSATASTSLELYSQDGQTTLLPEQIENRVVQALQRNRVRQGPSATTNDLLVRLIDYRRGFGTEDTDPVVADEADFVRKAVGVIPAPAV